MPILIGGLNKADAHPAGGEGGLMVGSAEHDCLEIGLVNNMPDGALQATEAQFLGLLGAAAGPRRVRVHLFSLPAVERGPAAAAHLATRYETIDDIGRAPLDALIVTGCEPRAPSLTDEPYWQSLTRLIDWAEHNTVSTLWSCLAAHAAVLHLDGIARRRLPVKRSGIFDCARVGAHPLTDGAPATLAVPHSRWNDLAEADLDAHGYTVLTRSEVAGVDLFIKRWNSLFVFFQGHPEYDVDSIAREYRRDVARFLRREQTAYPAMPQAYFDPETEAAFADIARRAGAGEPVALRDLPRIVGVRAELADTWQASVIPVFRNWLTLVEDGRRR